MESSGGNAKPISPAWPLIALTYVLMLALFWQFLDVYFTVGDVPEPTSGEHLRYVLTASACGAAAIGAVVAAVRRGRPGATGMSLVTVVVAFVAVLLFAVPTIDLRRDPEPNRLPDNYEPCFSGSNKCN